MVKAYLKAIDFPPPYGDIYSLTRWRGWCASSRHLSVSFQGESSISAVVLNSLKRATEIPSPFGVIYLEIQKNRHLLFVMTFRPLSERSISKPRWFAMICRMYSRIRPLTGRTVPKLFPDGRCLRHWIVSVPLRGELFLNTDEEITTCVRDYEYPSPYGENCS